LQSKGKAQQPINQERAERISYFLGKKNPHRDGDLVIIELDY
jgi:hypothetical protein